MTQPATPAAAEPKKKMSLWKRILIIVLVTVPLAAVAVVIGGFYILQNMLTPDDASDRVGIPQMPEKIITILQSPGKIFFKDRKQVNVLVLGVDTNWTNDNMPYTKDARSDTIFLLSFRADGKHLGMLSIPRDLYVEYADNHGSEKINSAYSLGGVNLARKTVQKLLGVPIDHTVIIKIEAAKKVVDALGGIELYVEKDMDYDDNWGHLHVHLKKGKQRLNGEQAVGYARFRNDEEGDRGRIRRQQQVVATLVKDLKADVMALPRVASIVKQHIETDIKAEELADLANVYKSFDRKNMVTGRVDGYDDEVYGMSVIIADPTMLKKLVARVVRGDNVLKPSDLLVEVLNGSDVAGAAATVAKALEAKGYLIARCDDVKSGKVAHSRIQMNSADPHVVESARRVNPELKVTELDGPRLGPPPDPNPDFTIILGQDWKERFAVLLGSSQPAHP